MSTERLSLLGDNGASHGSNHWVDAAAGFLPALVSQSHNTDPTFPWDFNLAFDTSSLMDEVGTFGLRPNVTNAAATPLPTAIAPFAGSPSDMEQAMMPRLAMEPEQSSFPSLSSPAGPPPNGAGPAGMAANSGAASHIPGTSSRPPDAGVMMAMTKTKAAPCLGPPAPPTGFRCPHTQCAALAAFSSQGQLNAHVTRKHTRRHACPQCGARFGTAKDRNRHVRTLHATGAPSPLSSVTPNRSVVCRFHGCRRNGRPFSRRDNYLKHLREVHGQQGSEKGAVDDAASDREESASTAGGDIGESASVCSRDVEALVSTGAGNLPEGQIGGDVEGKGKRRADGDDADVEFERFEELSRDGLVQLVILARQKCRRLSEEMREQRRRHEMREDMWLRLLAAKLEE